MKLDKKHWEAPQVIVLTRSKPEESVLEHCKIIGQGPGTTPLTVNQDGCNKDATKNCGSCLSRSGS
ncbi:MAG TPA: hypothetical protein PKN04_16395 [bacterium]|nr:hypothetical protein [bacterium]